jgi:hypothetical protein
VIEPSEFQRATLTFASCCSILELDWDSPSYYLSHYTYT